MSLVNLLMEPGIASIPPHLVQTVNTLGSLVPSPTAWLGASETHQRDPTVTRVRNGTGTPLLLKVLGPSTFSWRADASVHHEQMLADGETWVEHGCHRLLRVFRAGFNPGSTGAVEYETACQGQSVRLVRSKDGSVRHEFETGVLEM